MRCREKRQERRLLGAAPAIIIILVSGTLRAGDGALAPRSYDVEVFDVGEIEAAARSGRPVDLRWFGRARTLILEPARLRGRGFRAFHVQLRREASILEPARTFRGRLESEPESIVRLGVVRGGLRGMVKSSEGWVFFEPFRDGESGPGGAFPPGAHKVFTEGDVDLSFEGACAEAEEAGVSSPAAPEDSIDDSQPAELAAGSLRVLQVAVDADHEFHLAYGDAATAEIESILNVVDGIFQGEVGLTIQIVRTRIFSEEPDPYTSTSANTLLSELRNHWTANETAVGRDTVHLFTGKDLDGSTVGMAGLRAICNGNAYGLSQDLASDVIMPLLVAHEIGHNLGASHDPSTSDPRYIMHPVLSASNLDEYSAESKTAISSYTSGLSCLAELNPEPPPPPPPPPPSTTTPPPTKKGGGGGGPVDPIFAILLGAAALLSRRHG